MGEQYWNGQGRCYRVQRNSATPTVGLVLGIIAICAACIPIVNVAALIMGILATVFGLVGICKRSELGKSVAALVLGVFAVILVVLMYAGVFFAITWAIEQGETAEESATLDEPAEATPDQTAEILENMLDVSFGTFNVEEGLFNAPEPSLTVRVTNKTDRVQSFDITVSAYNAYGTIIATTTFYTDELEPWASQRIVIFDSVEAEKFADLKEATFCVTKAAVYEEN